MAEPKYGPSRPPSSEAASERASSLRSRTDALRVLLVEDSEMDAAYVKALLSRSVIGRRYTVTVFSEIGQLTGGAESARCDIVLLDLGLPGMSGLQAFEIARQSVALPIVVLSGLMDEEIAMEAVHRGAQDYLMKDELSARTLERAIWYGVERHRLYAELNQARKEAEAASEAKSEFLAVMSHEFRTPMNGIMGGLELVAECEVDEQARSLHAMMRQCAQSQLDLIDDVLDISRIESGKMEAEDEPFDLTALLESALAVVRYRAIEKRLELFFDRKPSVPRYVIADAKRLRQTLINLLGNAIKFTERGTVRLVVESLGTDRLLFKVVDTGIGIARDKWATIFEPFTQVDSSLRRRFQGSGLGLAICKRFVQLMGGEIDVESEPGAGATFSFSILSPVATEEEARAYMAANSMEEIGRDWYKSYPLKVLIAEDHLPSRLILRSLFENHGYTPVVACDGQQAVEAARVEDFDLILIDLQMPKLDGLQATVEILAGASRQGLRPPHIVAVTAGDLSANRDRCFDLGMKGYIAKPFRKADIENAIRAAYIARRG